MGGHKPTAEDVSFMRWLGGGRMSTGHGVFGIGRYYLTWRSLKTIDPGVLHDLA